MKELDIAGVYITPILGWALVALVVWTVLRRLIDPQRHPAVMRVVESGAFDDSHEYTEAEFEFGLERLLDGIQVLIDSRR